MGAAKPSRARFRGAAGHPQLWGSYHKAVLVSMVNKYKMVDIADESDFLVSLLAQANGEEPSVMELFITPRFFSKALTILKRPSP